MAQPESSCHTGTDTPSGPGPAGPSRPELGLPSAGSRQQELEYLHQVYLLSPDCIKIVDAQGRLQSMNRRGQQAMQVDDLSSCLGADWLSFWGGEGRGAMLRAFEAARAGQPAHFTGFCPTMKGEGRWWDVTIAPLDTPAGDLLVISRDITAQYEAQRRLAELNAHLEAEVERRTRALEQEQRRLQEMNEELRAMTYSMSHDLRTPVRHIQGFLQLARTHRDPARQQRYLDIAGRSAEQLSRMIESVLHLSRVSQVALRWQPVDLNAAMRSVLVELQPEQGERSVQWEIGELPTLTADGALLQAALKVLCSNALKFTRPVPEARITVRAERLDGAWALIVSDNGVGFDQKYAHKLFGLFQRLHRAEEFAGVGSGLALVRRIVARHGGSAVARGQPGAGATVVLTLPHQSPAHSPGAS